MKKNLTAGTKKTPQNSKLNEQKNAAIKKTNTIKNQVITKEDISKNENNSKNEKKYDFLQDLNVQVIICKTKKYQKNSF